MTFCGLGSNRTEVLSLLNSLFDEFRDKRWLLSLLCSLWSFLCFYSRTSYFFERSLIILVLSSQPVFFILMFSIAVKGVLVHFSVFDQAFKPFMLFKLPPLNYSCYCKGCECWEHLGKTIYCCCADCFLNRPPVRLAYTLFSLSLGIGN